MNKSAKLCKNDAGLFYEKRNTCSTSKFWRSFTRYFCFISSVATSVQLQNLPTDFAIALRVAASVLRVHAGTKQSSFHLDTLLRTLTYTNESRTWCFARRSFGMFLLFHFINGIYWNTPRSFFCNLNRGRRARSSVNEEVPTLGCLPRRGNY